MLNTPADQAQEVLHATPFAALANQKCRCNWLAPFLAKVDSVDEGIKPTYAWLDRCWTCIVLSLLHPWPTLTAVKYTTQNNCSKEQSI